MRMRMFNGCLRMRVAMRILAIDPGYDRLGIAVVEGSASRPILLWSDCVIPPKGAAAARLAEGVARGYKPSQHMPPMPWPLKHFFSINKKTAFGVAEARGAVLAAAGGVSPVVEYSPQQVKERGYRLWRRG